MRLRTRTPLLTYLLKDGMHDGMAAKQARSRVKSPHWWDDQYLIMWKFTKKEFVLGVKDYMADQDEPVGSNPPTWNFRRSGGGSKPDTPFIFLFVAVLPPEFTRV